MTTLREMLVIATIRFERAAHLRKWQRLEVKAVIVQRSRGGSMSSEDGLTECQCSFGLTIRSFKRRVRHRSTFVSTVQPAER